MSNKASFYELVTRFNLNMTQNTGLFFSVSIFHLSGHPSATLLYYTLRIQLTPHLLIQPKNILDSLYTFLLNSFFLVFYFLFPAQPNAVYKLRKKEGDLSSSHFSLFFFSIYFERGEKVYYVINKILINFEILLMNYTR